MRISDWSSDVCSSDLSGGSRDVRRIGIWGLIMHHACLAQVMTLAKEDQAAFFTLVATSIADMIAPATARARGTGTPLPIWRATGYGRPANVQQSGTPCRRARSEEHTSELQSLMRISS